MKVLHLTLKKKWFDMIASGEKKEEYRDETFYWKVRLMTWEWRERNNVSPFREFVGFNHFDAIRFKNGYGKDSPVVTVRFMGTECRVGRKEWGAEPYKEYFVIKLGDIITPLPNLL